MVVMVVWAEKCFPNEKPQKELICFILAESVIPQLSEKMEICWNLLYEIYIYISMVEGDSKDLSMQ